jgi:hypothetical protein
MKVKTIKDANFFLLLKTISFYLGKNKNEFEFECGIRGIKQFGEEFFALAQNH